MHGKLWRGQTEAPIRSRSDQGCSISTRVYHKQISDHNSRQLSCESGFVQDGKTYSPHVSQPGAAIIMEHIERDTVTATGYQAAGYAHKEFPPKHMLTAGLKQDYTDRSSPFSKGQESGSLHEKRCDSQALWTYKYQRPQYARKRCPDLMVSGPSTRAAPVTGQTVKTRGFHAYEASVGSTTTYQQHTSGDT